MSGKLFIIATPIGNLSDLTPRAVDTLKELDVLYCEDTRVTRKLLNANEIKLETRSYRDEVHDREIGNIANLLEEGKLVGYVSDAGTPAISDPGSRLVRDIVTRVPDADIIPIAGVSAVTAALSVSGFPAERFTFLGFPPHKKGRSKFFVEAMEIPYTVVMYESPHRILKALDAIAELAPDRLVCVCREITKFYETTYRGTASEIHAMLSESTIKGEIVVLIEKKQR